MNDDGSMARVPQLREFALRHNILLVTVADLIAYRLRTDSAVECVASTKLPTEYGEFRLHAFENQIDKQTHIALVHGDIGDGEDVLVRVHSQCLTGDVLRSVRCDCGAQLDKALSRIAMEGRGVLLYLSQEGRGSVSPTKFAPTVYKMKASTPWRPMSVLVSSRISEIMVLGCRSSVK